MNNKTKSRLLALLLCLSTLLTTSCFEKTDSVGSDDNISEEELDDTTSLLPELDDEFPKEPEPEQDRTKLTEREKSALEWLDSACDAAINGKTLDAGESTKEIGSEWSEVYDVVTREMRRYYIRFKNGDMSHAVFISLMTSISNIENARGLSESYITIAKSKHSSNTAIADAEKFVHDGKYMLASRRISRINPEDSTSVEKAKSLVSSDIDNFKTGVTEAVTEYMVRYELEAGAVYLERLRGYGIDEHVDSELSRLEKYRAYQEDGLEEVSVKETLENIYTHCLIAFPEINFASEESYGACGTDCLTPNEFRFLLGSLYEKGYVIVDAEYFYNADEDTYNSSIMLPAGKKPLILTFDDVTYDSRKMGRGMIDKLIVDEDGYICTYTKHKDGTEVIAYDNEIFPVLNAFVREHPEFTFRGGRGTLFFTGFDGICGYRTQSEPVNAKEAALGLDRQNEIAQAGVVIEALREEGWSFGCHGYNHSHMPDLSSSSFRGEIDLWCEEVGAIVGETGQFCWPYGDHGGGKLRKGEDHAYMYERGFYFFFGCGAKRYIANEPDKLGIFSDRKGITGQVLVYIAADYKVYLENYTYLFDAEKIWDPLRVPYKDRLVSGLKKKH